MQAFSETYIDVWAIAGFEPANSEYAHYAALQRQINSGIIWRLEGSAGRAAMRALEAGRVMLGHDCCSDYWGNCVPSREQVQDGTKGSFGLVAETMGLDYAERIADEE